MPKREKCRTRILWCKTHQHLAIRRAFQPLLFCYDGLQAVTFSLIILQIPTDTKTLAKQKYSPLRDGWPLKEKQQQARDGKGNNFEKFKMRARGREREREKKKLKTEAVSNLLCEGFHFQSGSGETVVFLNIPSPLITFIKHSRCIRATCWNLSLYSADTMIQHQSM